MVYGSPPMSSVRAAAVLIVVVVLLGPPVVSACAGLAVSMSCCPESEAQGRSCHTPHTMSLDCCTVEPLQDPPAAAGVATSDVMLVSVSPSPGTIAPGEDSVGSTDLPMTCSSVLHELGRFTLFSAFLL